ncbi:MAG: hypothetical protein PHP69_07415 [Candidatus Omnitrophica bacterium]|nr:hypothetical protein [Candidatus Omnitrophota bacterium]
MKKKIFFFIIGLFLFFTTVYSANEFVVDNKGNVGIGTNSPEAVLDVAGNAILPPRNSADSDVTDPKEGMMYYNTATKRMRVYDGAEWKNIGGNSEIVSGIYTGNGTGWIEIEVGFRPRIVMLLPHGQGPEVYSDNLTLKLDVWPTSGTMWGNGYKWTDRYVKDAEGYDNPYPNHPYDYSGIIITDTGFKTNWNVLYRPYSWIAIE